MTCIPRRCRSLSFTRQPCALIWSRPDPLRPASSTSFTAMVRTVFASYTALTCLFLPARSRIINALHAGIVKGRLVVEEQDTSITIGCAESIDTTTVKVNNPAMWTRILVSHDLGCQSVSWPPVASWC